MKAEDLQKLIVVIRSIYKVFYDLIKLRLLDPEFIVYDQPSGINHTLSEVLIRIVINCEDGELAKKLLSCGISSTTQIIGLLAKLKSMINSNKAKVVFDSQITLWNADRNHNLNDFTRFLNNVLNAGASLNAKSKGFTFIEILARGNVSDLQCLRHVLI